MLYILHLAVCGIRTPKISYDRYMLIQVASAHGQDYYFIVILLWCKLLYKCTSDDATRRAWTADPPGEPEFTPINFNGSMLRVAQSLVFCVVVCRSLFFPLSFSFRNYIVCPSPICNYAFIVSSNLT